MKKEWVRRRRAVCITISGGCVGFITGLSVSPVAGVVLSSVVAVVVALTSALAGLGTDPSPDEPGGKLSLRRTRVAVNPLPVTLLLLGMVAGSIAGIWTRTHDWLGTLNTSGTTGTSETGPSKEQKSGPATTGETGKSRAGVLYSAEASECSDWHGINDAAVLRANMVQSKTVSSKPSLVRLTIGCSNFDCLQGLVEALCSK